MVPYISSTVENLEKQKVITSPPPDQCIPVSNYFINSIRKKILKYRFQMKHMQEKGDWINEIAKGFIFFLVI